MVKKNEYIKAQELAVLGLSLDEVDAEKALVDKLELPLNCINGTVVAKIDAHLNKAMAVKLAVKKSKEVKKVEKKEKKDKV